MKPTLERVLQEAGNDFGVNIIQRDLRAICKSNKIIKF
jgi:hypothetical protein